MELCFWRNEKSNSRNVGQRPKLTHRYANSASTSLFFDWKTTTSIPYVIELDVGFGLEGVDYCYGDYWDGYTWSVDFWWSDHEWVSNSYTLIPPWEKTLINNLSNNLTPKPTNPSHSPRSKKIQPKKHPTFQRYPRKNPKISYNVESRWIWCRTFTYSFLQVQIDLLRVLNYKCFWISLFVLFRFWLGLLRSKIIGKRFSFSFLIL